MSTPRWRPRHARRPDAEDAVATARWLLAMIAAAVHLGSRSPQRGSELPILLFVALAILMMPVVPALLRRWLNARRWAPFAVSVVLQIVDTTAATAILLAAERFAPGTAWAVLVVPVVIAALRFGPVGVLATWAGTGLAQLAVVRPAAANPPSVAAIVERGGVLLVVAAVVALLTSWLQAGWVTQAHLTGAANRRLRYGTTVRRAGRAMRDTSTRQVLGNVLGALPHLDFEAGTLSRRGTVLAAVGDGQIVPTAVDLDVGPGEGLLTTWERDTGSVHSISVLEVRTGLLVSGWSQQPISDLQIDAVSDLMVDAGMHIELGERLQAARHEADHDPLTGLLRRHVFDKQLADVAAQPQDIAVLFIDLDYFKHINDNFGHHAGDAALKVAAERLNEVLGHLGPLARFGGDEFVAVLTGPDALQAVERGREARDAILRPIVFEGNVLPLGATVGAASGHGPLDPAELLHEADEQVLASKARRNEAAKRSGAAVDSRGGPLPPQHAVEAAIATADMLSAGGRQLQPPIPSRRVVVDLGDRTLGDRTLGERVDTLDTVESHGRPRSH